MTVTRTESLTETWAFSGSGAIALKEKEPVACRLVLPEASDQQPAWVPSLPSVFRRWAIQEVKPTWRLGIAPTRNRELLESFCPLGHRSWRLTAGEGADILLATRHDTLLIGREPAANDLALSWDDHVTGTAHCAFVLDPSGGVNLVDLGSRNGTEVNGRSLAPFESMALHENDLIRVGATPVRIIG